jgi:hypothetical protein
MLEAGMKDFTANNRAEKVMARAALFNWNEAAASLFKYLSTIGLNNFH